jgi:predicted DNA-binding transcriptional regulator AlpA
MTRRFSTTDRVASNARDGVATSREVAEYVGTTESQLARLRYVGQGPSYIRTPGGRTIRSRWSDVDAWLDAGRIQTDNGG